MESLRHRPKGGLPPNYEYVTTLSDDTKEGSVILVKDRSQGIRYVMKVFHMKKSMKSIENEIRMQTLFYPFTVRIIDHRDNWMIMEEGIPSKTILKKHPEWIDQFITDFFQLLVHQMKLSIGHFDTKMDNIVYYRHHFVFIDFGFSKKVKACRDVGKVFWLSIKRVLGELRGMQCFSKPQLQRLEDMYDYLHTIS